MHDSSPIPPPGPADPLAFTPLPCARRDGWTASRQQAFIEQLARIGVVSAAAREVGMSAKSAYALRNRAGGASGFAAAWDTAVDRGRVQALGSAIDRAINGEAIPVFYRGQLVGHRIRYDNRLLLAALRVTRPGGEAALSSEGTKPWHD